jgi:hypothetical protein
MAGGSKKMPEELLSFKQPKIIMKWYWKFENMHVRNSDCMNLKQNLMINLRLMVQDTICTKVWEALHSIETCLLCCGVGTVHTITARQYTCELEISGSGVCNTF